VLQGIPEQEFKIVKLLASTYVRVENTDFEYPDEQFNINGKNFNLVKQRIHNDSLELYLLNNVKQDELTANFKDYVEENVLNKSNNSNKKPFKLTLKDLLKNYLLEEHTLPSWQVVTLHTPFSPKITLIQNDIFIPNTVLTVLNPPPEANIA
jgi:hypothetical protein